MKPELPAHLSCFVRRRGFTLAELLVVMAIIAIVIALIVPALGGSRNAARAGATKQQITQISNACSSFVNDERRTPGHFSAREMGVSENLTMGMSETENVMLDLIGWQKAANTSNEISVGPSATGALKIDYQLIGVPGQGSKQYYVPDKRHYLPQTALSQQMANTPNANAAAEGDPKQLPDVVDEFLNPILIWRQDDTYVTKPSSTNYKFAVTDSGTGQTGAKYYWASNACFLTAPQLGKKQLDQTHPTKGSLLGVNGAATATSVAGFLGGPNAPYRPAANLNAVPTVAMSGRAPIVVHSAGIDGYYLGRQDKGGKLFANGITYGTNFAPDIASAIGPTNQYVDKDGKPTNIDLLADFDDLFSYGGS